MFSRCVWIAAMLCGGQALGRADWPQWRGPERSGHAPAGARLALPVPVEPKVLWRVPVGQGLASPVIANGRLYHLDNQNGHETVHALDAGTGKEIWSAPLDQAFQDTQSPPGPRCTPLVDEDRVYAQSCRGELKCFAAKDGHVLWRVNYVRDFGAVFTGEKGPAAGASRHGYNGSPLIDGNRLIVCAGGTNDAAVVALDKRTGAVLWKSQRDTAAYAPPIMTELAGQRQVVAFMVESLMGLDPRDGRVLWRVPFRTTFGRHVTTPVVVADKVMISSHEFGLVGVSVTREGDRFNAGVAWTNKPAAINFSSPVAVEGYLYGVGATKNLVCVEAATGRLAWSKEGYFTSAAGNAHAGMVVVDGKILMLTDGGQLLAMAADSKECRELRRAQVCGQNWCNPAWVDGRLYLRDGRHLLAVALGAAGD